MRKNQLLIDLSLFITSLLISSVCLAQVSQEWEARYDGPLHFVDQLNSMVIDKSGNIYVTGWSPDRHGISTNTDYTTIKYNETGERQWLARYNGPANFFDDAFAIAVDAAGNVYVTGGSFNVPIRGDRFYDIVTVKYNADGVQQWVASYDGFNNEDFPRAIAVDALGNVLVTGYSVNPRSGYDYVTIKYNKFGEESWVRRYNGPGNGLDKAFSLAVDASGVYVTGVSTGSRLTREDFATIKYSNNGERLWIVRYNGPDNGNDGAADLVLDALEENVYVAGIINSDYGTIKYNALTGALQWAARYNGPADRFDMATSLGVDLSGNVYVTGFSNGDYATIKYNNAGEEQWAKRYSESGSSSDQAYSLTLDASANVYVTGTSGPFLSGDIVSIKYNTTGSMQWLARYNGPAKAADDANKDNMIAVDLKGNVYVSGISRGIGTNYDYVTIKYSQSLVPPPDPLRIPIPHDPITISLSSNLDKNRVSSFRVSNFPNPVTSTARIQYEIPFDGRMSITVYDVAGREVKTLVKSNINAGHHSTYFDASALQNGVYYYKALLQNGVKELKQTGKMIIVK